MRQGYGDDDLPCSTARERSERDTEPGVAFPGIIVVTLIIGATFDFDRTGLQYGANKQCRDQVVI